MTPGRGLQATHDGALVYILDTFTRRGRSFADVAEIRARGASDECTLGRVKEAPFDALKDVRFEDALEVLTNNRVRLRRRGSDEPSAPASSLGLAAVASMRGSMHTLPAQSSRCRADGVRCVVPAGASQHIEDTARLGCAHRVGPVERHTDTHFVNDLPLPVEFDARSYRCWTCAHISRTPADDTPLDDDHAQAISVDSSNDEATIEQLMIRQMPLADQFSADSSSDEATLEQLLPRQVPLAAKYWAVSDDDVRREFPGVLACRAGKRRPVWMTPLFFTELCLQFHECINARQLRRQLAGLYAANALAEQCRIHTDGSAAYSSAWSLRALPGNRELRAIVLRGFAGFVRARVRVMRRRQLLYNGQGLRHDCCFWLAKILITHVSGGVRSQQCIHSASMCRDSYSLP